MVYDKQFFKSSRYLRACELMRIPPYANPNYEKELKAVGMWKGRKKKKR